MINSLQILRAFAAYAVFFTHYALFGLHIGGFGVDIFFIISGFVIAFVIDKSTKDFFIKRIIRVAPLYTVATLLTATLALLKPEWFKTVIVSGEALIKSLLYIPYKIQDSGPILSLGWTLNFEMFFYVSMAICILFVRNKSWLVPVCAGLLLFFLVLLNIVKIDSYGISFYGRGLLPEFIMGLLLYYFWEFLQKSQSNSGLNMFFGMIGLLALFFLIYTGLTKDFNDINRNIRTGIPCLLIVGGAMALEPYINGKSKAVKFLSLIGDSSYAMYLFHPFILFGCTRVLFPFVFKYAGGGQQNLWVQLTQFILISITLIGVSILIYKWIDKPLNNYLRKVVLEKR